jgi:hypothetical protein
LIKEAYLFFESGIVGLGVGQSRVEDVDVLPLLLQRVPLRGQLNLLAFFGRT